MKAAVTEIGVQGGGLAFTACRVVVAGSVVIAS